MNASIRDRHTSFRNTQYNENYSKNRIIVITVDQCNIYKIVQILISVIISFIIIIDLDISIRKQFVLITVYLLVVYFDLDSKLTNETSRLIYKRLYLLALDFFLFNIYLSDRTLSFNSIILCLYIMERINHAIYSENLQETVALKVCKYLNYYHLFVGFALKIIIILLHDNTTNSVLNFLVNQGIFNILVAFASEIPIEIKPKINTSTRLLPIVNTSFSFKDIKEEFKAKDKSAINSSHSIEQILLSLDIPLLIYDSTIEKFSFISNSLLGQFYPDKDIKSNILSRSYDIESDENQIKLKNTLNKYRYAAPSVNSPKANSNANLYEELIYNRFQYGKFFNKDSYFYVKVKSSLNLRMYIFENINETVDRLHMRIIKNLKEKFILTISHELNNPLNALVLTVEELINLKNQSMRKFFLNDIRKYRRQIKYFLKAISIYIKCIMSGVFRLDMLNLNFGFCINKIIENYECFLRPKKNKLIIDEKANTMFNSLIIKSDNNLICFFLKTIVVLISKKLDKRDKVTVYSEHRESEKKVIVHFNRNENKGIQFIGLNHAAEINSSIKEDIEIEETVETEEMLTEILICLSKKLNLELAVNNKGRNPSKESFLSFCLNYVELDEKREDFNLSEYHGESHKQFSENIEDLKKKCTHMGNCKNLLMLENKEYNISNPLSPLSSENSFSIRYKRDSKVHLKRMRSDIDSSLDFKMDMNYETPERERGINMLNKKCKFDDHDHSIYRDYSDSDSAVSIPEVKLNIKTPYKGNSKNMTSPNIKTSNLSPKNIMISLPIAAESSELTKENLSSKFIDTGDLKLTTNELEISQENYKQFQRKHSSNRSSPDFCFLDRKSTPENLEEKDNQIRIQSKDAILTREQINAVASKKSLKSILSNKNKKHSVPSPQKNVLILYPDPSQMEFQLSQTNEDPSMTPVKRKSNRSKSSTSRPFRLYSQKVNPSKMCECNEIMAVDDEKFNLKTYCNIAQKMDANLDTALNGLIAYEKFVKKCNFQCEFCERNSYRLIIMDLMMPVMDGVEASNSIKAFCDENSVDTNIVIISAHDSERVALKFKENEYVKEFYTKPIKRTLLENLIRKYVCQAVDDNTK